MSAGAQIALSPMTMVYAENGRGKTTLAAVLRSLATGDPIPIAERRRLNSQNPPHVVLECTGGPPPAIFDNNAWNRTLPELVVFDDTFIDENVCSGLAVDPEHRQNLHELILGTEGVQLNTALQATVARVEECNKELRAKDQAIPAGTRGPFSVDEFCVVPERPDIDAVILEADRNLAAAREQQNVQRMAGFDSLVLPAIDLRDAQALLSKQLPDVEAAALASVQAHIAEIGSGAERWVEDGTSRIIQNGEDQDCPFCAQPLAASPVVAHYRAYFSQAYRQLKESLSKAQSDLDRIHGASAQLGFERNARIAAEKHQFWSRFAEVPVVEIDTAAITESWTAAKEGIANALAAKQAAPLEPIALSAETLESLEVYEGHCKTVEALNSALQTANTQVALVKERAASSDVQMLSADSARLKATKIRHTAAVAALCAEYQRAKSVKSDAEIARTAARDALDRHRSTAFPAYQNAINTYLHRFNAGFRLDQVVSTNIRGGSSCTYNLVVNNHPVPVGGATPPPGSPSFKTTLSAGDRNTLALAFFFASLDQDPNRGSRIVVIDDPITSLDEGRALTTVQEMRRLVDQVQQVIVLSHNRPFLCNIWEGMDANRRAALEVVRDAVGSTIRAWDVSRDAITEHDRRHKLIRDYIATNVGDPRQVAQGLRLTLEAFLRVAHPEHFPPGTLLGHFCHICTQRVGTQNEILSARELQELEELKEYANLFHHDTNQAWQSVAINDVELLHFAMRTINFAK